MNRSDLGAVREPFVRDLVDAAVVGGGKTYTRSLWGACWNDCADDMVLFCVWDEVELCRRRVMDGNKRPRLKSVRVGGGITGLAAVRAIRCPPQPPLSDFVRWTITKPPPHDFDNDCQPGLCPGASGPRRAPADPALAVHAVVEVGILPIVPPSSVMVAEACTTAVHALQQCQIERVGAVWPEHSIMQTESETPSRGPRNTT